MDEIKHEIIKPTENVDIQIAYINTKEISNRYNTHAIKNIPPHWHRSIEFSYIKKGTVTVWFQDGQKQLQTGDFIFINSSEVHGMTSNHPNECEIILTIIPYNILKQFIPNIDELYFDIYQKEKYSHRFYEIFQFFFDYTQQPKPYDRLKMNQYIFELLHILCTQYQSTNHNKFQHRKIQHQILDFIEENYTKDLTLKSLAHAFHFNSEYLSRKFKELFGVNFKSYLTQYRLQQSLHDIIYSNDNIQDIALSYGFASVKSYILSFKQYYGTTPYQYRINYRNP